MTFLRFAFEFIGFLIRERHVLEYELDKLGKWRQAEDLVDILFLRLEGKYCMLFPRIASSHIMCAQKIHSKVAFRVIIFCNSSFEFYKA